jgi:hypothetical protein
VRVVALSGGYTRDDACAKLSHDQDMIASFSRALVEDLTYQMSDAEFDKSLGHSIDEIFKAESGRRPMAGAPPPPWTSRQWAVACLRSSAIVWRVAAGPGIIKKHR